MRRAIATTIWRFSTNRMLHEYVEQLYLPAAGVESGAAAAVSTPPHEEAIAAAQPLELAKQADASHAAALESGNGAIDGVDGAKPKRPKKRKQPAEPLAGGSG